MFGLIPCCFLCEISNFIYFPSINLLLVVSKRCHGIIYGTCHVSVKCARFISDLLISIVYRYPYDSAVLWFIALKLLLSSDVHPNPGPFNESNFSSGFLTFCNWNLNTLSKNDFYRVTLLEAFNVNMNYDIISLCETSLNETIVVEDNLIPGYKFYPWNHPDGSRNGGVGIFYKESLPLRVRLDLSFEECLVSELMFGHKKIFFTVLYRNPANKVSSPKFDHFIKIFSKTKTTN